MSKNRTQLKKKLRLSKCSLRVLKSLGKKSFQKLTHHSTTILKNLATLELPKSHSILFNHISAGKVKNNSTQRTSTTDGRRQKKIIFHSNDCAHCAQNEIRHKHMHGIVKEHVKWVRKRQSVGGRQRKKATAFDLNFGDDNSSIWTSGCRCCFYSFCSISRNCFFVLFPLFFPWCSNNHSVHPFYARWCSSHSWCK